MYISSTANNKPLIYKCPRLAQSSHVPWQRGRCYARARTHRGDPPHRPPCPLLPHPRAVDDLRLGCGTGSLRHFPVLRMRPQELAALLCPAGYGEGWRVPGGRWPLVALVG